MVENYNQLPDEVNVFKALLDKHMGTPTMPLLLRERRRDWAGPHHEGGERDGPQQVA